MPNIDFTSKLLMLEDAIIENVEIFSTHTEISFKLKRRPHSCPCCGNVTEKVHDYRTSKIKDIPVSGQKTILLYSKRRYHCDSCNKHFYESFPLVPKHCRTTTRLAFFSVSLLNSRQSVRSAADLSGVSVSFVFRRLKDLNFPKPKVLPQVLSIDEFKGNAGGQKFQAIITDPKKHKVIDILPSRTQATLSNYFSTFKNRKDVRFFVMDMNRAYLEIAKTYFPKATIVIDKFHVVRYVTWALENVRKKIQKQMHPDKRKYFKRSRRLLLTHKEKLNDEPILALEVMLQQSSELATAYHLKELFYTFIKAKDRNEASELMHKFIISTEASGLKEFDACLTMLRNWATYILNAFDCGYSNGFTEGTNNSIKVIKRNAFGYRSFQNFRNRILMSVNK